VDILTKQIYSVDAKICIFWHPYRNQILSGKL
jgi:hypothetical protein